MAAVVSLFQQLYWNIIKAYGKSSVRSKLFGEAHENFEKLVFSSSFPHFPFNFIFLSYLCIIFLREYGVKPIYGVEGMGVGGIFVRMDTFDGGLVGCQVA